MLLFVPSSSISSFWSTKILTLEYYLCRKSAELEELAASHKSTIEKLQEEYNQLQFKFGETTTEFEKYVNTMA